MNTYTKSGNLILDSKKTKTKFVLLSQKTVGNDEYIYYVSVNGKVSPKSGYDNKDIAKKFFNKEYINLPVEIGDVILTGKFRNKKVVVKTITTNERGEPLINGKPIINFRLTKPVSEKLNLLHESLIRNDVEFTDDISEIMDEYRKVKNFMKKFGIGGRTKTFSDEKGATGKIRDILQRAVQPKEVKGKDGETVFKQDKTVGQVEQDVKDATVKFKDGQPNVPTWKVSRVVKTELSSIRTAGKLLKWLDMFGPDQTVEHIQKLDSKTGEDSKAFRGSVFTIRFLLEHPEYRIPTRPNNRGTYRLSRSKQHINSGAVKWANKFKKGQWKKSVKL